MSADVSVCVCVSERVSECVCVSECVSVSALSIRSIADTSW